MKRLLALCALLCVAAVPAPTQSPSGPWSAAVRDKMLTQIEAQLQHYFFVERVPKLDAALETNRGSLVAIEDPSKFADAITKILQGVTHDKHLNVFYSPQPQPISLKPSAADRAKMKAFDDYVTHGFSVAARLNGNIGYFRIGTAGEIELAALLRAHGIARVVDVRSVPKSRARKHVWSEQMAVWVPDLAGARYEWRADLGGFRRPRPDSPNVALRHPSFRGYADYMQTPVFLTALTELVGEAAQAPTTILCSESLWWRCHRRLIADAATLLHGAEVRHIMHTGPAKPHVLTRGVRVLPDGTLRYDAEL